jgi:hypothetical protein
MRNDGEIQKTKQNMQIFEITRKRYNVSHRHVILLINWWKNNKTKPI